MSACDAGRLQVVLLRPIGIFNTDDAGLLFVPLAGDQLQYFFVVLLLLGVVERTFHKRGGFTVQKLQTGKVLHDVPQERHHLLAAGVVLNREFLEDLPQFGQFAGLEIFDFNTVISEEEFFQFDHLLYIFDENNEISLEVEFVQIG